MSNPNVRSRSYDLLWLGLGLLPLLAVALLLPVPAQDYWWYLRLGQDILKAGSVPLTDTISSTRLGQPVFYQAWLAALVFWWVYRLGGAALTFLLRAALIGFTYGVTWGMMRRASGPRLATLLLIPLGLSTSTNWAVRPQLLVYPLFALCLWALYRWQERENRFLWLLPVSMLLWVNLHGSFVLLFALAGAALIFGKGDRRALLIALALMALATLANPHGLGVWRYLTFMLSNPSDQLYSVEWAPPRNAGWQMNIFFGWLLAFAVLAGFSPRKLSALEWAWFIGFGWLALSGVRYVIWFHLLMAVLTARLLADWARAKLDRPPEAAYPAINIAIAALLLLLPLALLPGVRDAWWKDAPPLYEASTTPVRAVQWLSAHPELPGPMWNDYAFGSYLAYALPSRPTSIDTRMFNFTQDQWAAYVTASGADLGWDEILDRGGANLLLLATASQSRLIDAVSGSGAWCERYRDADAVIFSRCEPVP